MAELITSHLLSRVPFVAASALGWQAVFSAGSWFSSRYFSDVYGKLSRRDKIQWNARFVSTAHCLITTVLALALVFDGTLGATSETKIHGHSDLGDVLFSLSAGYFAWDIGLVLAASEGLAYLFHGLSCFIIYFFVLRPSLMYYGACFLLFEASTVFLNVRGTFAQMRKVTPLSHRQEKLASMNDVAFFFVFFCCRILWGYTQSYDFWVTMLSNPGALPTVQLVTYLVLNLGLNSLNTLWFSRMVKILMRGLRGPRGSDKEA